MRRISFGCPVNGTQVEHQGKVSHPNAIRYQHPAETINGQSRKVLKRTISDNLEPCIHTTTKSNSARARTTIRGEQIGASDGL